MKLIQSRDNPFYREIVKIAGSSRQRSRSNQTLLDGAHLLAAYLDAGMRPQHILVNVAALQDDEITSLLERVGDIPVTQLDDKLFAKLSELKTPTGILALIQIPQPQTSVEQSRFALLLEDIQDPGNLGSMLRSAAAAGCDAVFMSPGCADAWSPRVLRAAMGGHFALHVFEQRDLPGVAKEFCEQPQRGLPAYPSAGKLLAASLQAKQSLYDCDLSGKVAFLIGNEGAGLSGELLNLATQRIAIPMRGKVESLNAAAATAICLFEALRQRQTQ
ncbi:MAG: RNA methyltransferase [Gallionella sp.]